MTTQASRMKAEQFEARDKAYVSLKERRRGGEEERRSAALGPSSPHPDLKTFFAHSLPR